MSVKKTNPLDVSLYMRFLHQEHKLPVICIIRKRYPKTKIVRIAIFAIIFVTGI